MARAQGPQDKDQTVFCLPKDFNPWREYPGTLNFILRLHLFLPNPRHSVRHSCGKWRWNNALRDWSGLGDFSHLSEALSRGWQYVLALRVKQATSKLRPSHTRYVPIRGRNCCLGNFAAGALCHLIFLAIRYLTETPVRLQEMGLSSIQPRNIIITFSAQ